MKTKPKLTLIGEVHPEYIQRFVAFDYVEDKPVLPPGSGRRWRRFVDAADAIIDGEIKRLTGKVDCLFIEHDKDAENLKIADKFREIVTSKEYGNERERENDFLELKKRHVYHLREQGVNTAKDCKDILSKFPLLLPHAPEYVPRSTSAPYVAAFLSVAYKAKIPLIIPIDEPKAKHKCHVLDSVLEACDHLKNFRSLKTYMDFKKFVEDRLEERAAAYRVREEFMLKEIKRTLRLDRKEGKEQTYGAILGDEHAERLEPELNKLFDVDFQLAGEEFGRLCDEAERAARFVD